MLSSRSIQIRLFLTCWLVFVLHYATDFVREHYLVVTIADDFTFRLDRYKDLHVDIFETPRHGAHHGANPGISMVAAVPYLIFKPAVDRVVAFVAERRAGMQATGVYRDPRPARVDFYRKVRERGLDIKFGLVGLITMAFCMAPLSALSVVAMFRVLGHLGVGARLATWLSLLYAFGTPLLFRTAFLNQNMAIGVFAFLAFLLLWQPGGPGRLSVRQRYALAGLLGGLSVLCDYSGVVVLGVLGLYGLVRLREGRTPGAAIRESLWYVAGAVPGILLLWLYQYRSFGNPFFPGQHYMAPVEWIDVGYKGFGGPKLELFTDLLFDPRYGLVPSAPLLVLALGAPLLSARGKSYVPRRETWWALAVAAGFILFFSCVQYTRLQFVTGIRYITPVIPFLFLLSAAVLVRLPRAIALPLVALAVAEEWCMAMVRSQQGVLVSVRHVLTEGLQLPWLSTLSRMTERYVPVLDSRAAPYVLMALCALTIYGIWRVRAAGPSLGWIGTTGAAPTVAPLPSQERARE